MDCITLAQTLIDIPSVTGHEEKIGDFLKGYLTAAGFQVASLPVSNCQNNIWAYTGTPRIVFSTHMDTVPPYFPARIENGCLYGRGACDTKGIMAAQIRAAVALLDKGETDFGLLFVVGEERGSAGAIAANNMENPCRFLINGEPTDNCLASGTKGVFRGLIETQGRPAHAAYPDKGESAIYKLIDIIQTIRNYDWPIHEVLGDTVFSVGTIKGGTTANVVPDWAQCEVMFRSVENSEAMQHRLEQLIGDNADVTPLYTCDPVMLKTIDGFDARPVSYATDISSLTQWGQPLLFGPGSILDAHSDHENISIEALDAAVSHYQTIYHALKEQL